ncbi:MAG: cation:proton antiporter [Bacilli bacterium]|nr:cation:proton antiporter [Bacilli bacterium]
MLKSYLELSSKSVVITLATMLFFGFLLTRITKKLKLPNVTAYIITGILIGPYCFNLVSMDVVKGMTFLPDIALAFIAFGVGEYFKLDIIKKNGYKVIIITLFEALMASLFVFLVLFFICRLDFGFSLVLAALASATAPASTLMTIRQTKAHGDYVNTLLQVVALDDVVSLLAYSVAISIATSLLVGSVAFNPINMIVLPLLKNILIIIIGFVFGVVLKFLLLKRSEDNRLIISISLLLAFCGIATLLDVSPLLGCMIMGASYINLSNDESLFKQLNYFNPPILLLFFVYSGVNFDLKSIVSMNVSMGVYPLLVIGILYFITRIIGKYIGSYLGCKIVKKPKNTTNYLGLALVPQAGVAIGLAALGARSLGGELGNNLQTIILASSVLYEIIGPTLSKLGLYLSKSYSNVIEEKIILDENNKTNLELLIERINIIQEEIKNDPIINEYEDAFNEAIKEQELYILRGNKQ